MFYILHHSKGALMLSAGNREQVLTWSERQLGSQAGLVSITDEICKDAVNTVEKDGTGIGTGDDMGCQPLMGVMANIAQDVYQEHGNSEGQYSLKPGSRLGIKQPTWH